MFAALINTGDRMRYETPHTSKEASRLLAAEKGKAFVLAGGTDLLVRLSGGYIEPDLIVDIKRIDAVREIRKTDEGFRIGAAVSCAELGERRP